MSDRKHKPKRKRSCEAWCPVRSYAPAHRCEKVYGVELVAGRRLCPHHAAMKSVKFSETEVTA